MALELIKLNDTTLPAIAAAIRAKQQLLAASLI